MKGHTNTHTITYNIPTPTPTEKANLKAWTAVLDKHERNNNGDKDQETNLERRENDQQQNDRGPIGRVKYLAEEGDATPNCKHTYIDHKHKDAMKRGHKHRGIAKCKGSPNTLHLPYTRGAPLN